MEWLESIQRAIRYVEDNLTEEIDIDAVARYALSSGAHFQRVFHIVTGYTLGEYIRNRRLSAAGQELLRDGAKVIDTALRYGYGTPESFCKAFSRFHGFTPLDTRQRRGELKTFAPLSFQITIRGGFAMTRNFANEFMWGDDALKDDVTLTPAQRYQKLVNWAAKARGCNPNVFDTLNDWLLDDSEWTEDKLAENEQILMRGVLQRFRTQNAVLRERLTALAPTGIVNSAVFQALNRFDEALSGRVPSDELSALAARVFEDFSTLRPHSARALFAGNKTGPTGTANVETFGYMNCLENCDAGVQWTLFMPDATKAQQKGFWVERFEYMKMPAMRFIGCEGEAYASPEGRKPLFAALDAMDEYRSGFNQDILLSHFNGQGVDVGVWHGCWGRFMKADTPVPDGFMCIDFVPVSDGKAGTPYLSQFAYAVFAGDPEAMHSRSDYDDSAMYDITRNIILGQGVNIPYPEKYWTAEAFPDGHDKPSTAYLFSAEQ